MGLDDLMRARLAAAPQLAPGTLELLEAPGAWVRRRVERIDLVGLEEVDVAASLDVHLPRAVQERVAVDDGRLVIVPLGYGEKGAKLTRFDLTADGDPASLLTLAENTVLSAAVLGVLARRCGAGPEVDAPLEALCGPLPPPDDARRLRLEVLRALVRPARDDAERLVRWLTFLTGRYVLYGSLHRDPAAPVEQRLVRTAQTLPATPVGSGTPGPRVRNATLGELRVTLPVFDLGFASSYHLDLGVPAELRIVSAVLRDPDADRLDADVDRDRATLETRGRRPYAGQGEVALVVRPEQRALSGEAWPASAAMAVATFLTLVPVAYDRPTPAGLAALVLAPVAAGLALAFRSFPDEVTRVLVGRQQRYLRIQLGCLLAAVLLLLARPLAPSWDAVHDALGPWATTPLAVLVALLATAPLLGALLGAVVQRRAHRDAPARPAA